MLDVASLEKFDFFKNFVLIAGVKGLYRNISNVVILDYEGIEGDFSGFHEGDFVITNMLFAKNDISRKYPAFKALIDIGVSAFAIKTVFFTELPAEVLALAEHSRIPVFFFHDIYIEDVILSITDHLRSSANYNYYENLIDSFLLTPSHHAQIHELLHSLLPDEDQRISEKTVTSLSLFPPTDTDEFSLQRTINKLMLQANHMKTKADLRILKYQKGILFLSFEEKQNSPENTSAMWNDIMKELNLTKYIAGISDQPLQISKIDIAIERSLHACRMSVKHGCQRSKYSDLGLCNLIFSIYKDRYSCEFLAEKAAVLHPAKHAALKDTMQELVLHDFEIDPTAEALFQHPNTIRYRIGKLKDLFRVKNDLEFQILCILLSKDEYSDG